MLCESMPGIEWFTNDNPYTECNYKFHYIVIPDVKDESLTVKIWNGLFCYEKSQDQILTERVFPMTKGGLNEMVEYIREQGALFEE